MTGTEVATVTPFSNNATICSYPRTLAAYVSREASPEWIERQIAEGSDRSLCRINVLDFAKVNDLDEEHAIAAFLHGARLGIFDMSWVGPQLGWGVGYGVGW